MALIFDGKTVCKLCGEVLAKKDELTAFPAFLYPDHPLWMYSDAAFHKACYELSPQKEEVDGLFARWTKIWDSRPKNLTRVEEMDVWGREAFKDFP